MEVKSLGSGSSFARTVNYLGTTGDNTPSHKNPGRTGYLIAKKHDEPHKRYYMDYFSPYLRRDLITFGNMPCGSKRQIERYEQRLMAHHGNRHAKSFEFVLMPSSADKIDPHNTDSILRFKHYVNDWVNYAFNGKFERTESKTRRGHRRYRFVKTPGQEFSYYAVIQPDSHNNGHTHAHVVVINDNLKTGKALNSKYYGIHHLRRAVNLASHDYGFSRATQLKKNHAPSKIEKKIIESARNLRHNPTITSRPKLIKALAKNGIEAKYRRNKKHPKRSGWKFKVSHHSFIKASRISHAIGGSFLATASIDKTLSNNRKLKAQAKKRAKKERQERQERLHRRREQRRELILNERKIQHDKATKKRKHIKQARLLHERNKELIRIKSAVKKSRQVRHQHNKECQRYHRTVKEDRTVRHDSFKECQRYYKGLKAKANLGARPRHKSRITINNFKEQIKRFAGRIKKFANKVKSLIQRPKRRAVKTSWRDYKQSSIQADKYVHNEAKEAIGKKPQKPTRQVQSSVATTPKSSTAKSESDSDSGSLDKQILKRAKQLRSERGKGEPPLP